MSNLNATSELTTNPDLLSTEQIEKLVKAMGLSERKKFAAWKSRHGVETAWLRLQASLIEATTAEVKAEPEVATTRITTGAAAETAAPGLASEVKATTAEVKAEPEVATTSITTGAAAETAAPGLVSEVKATTTEVNAEPESATTSITTGAAAESAASGLVSEVKATTTEVNAEPKAVTTPITTGVTTIFAQTGTGPHESKVIPIRRPSMSIAIATPTAATTPAATTPAATTPAATTPAATTPAATTPAATTPATPVTHSFRVCQPTTLDASKPAWSFTDGESKPKTEPAPLPAPEPKANVIEKEADQQPVTKDAIAWVAAHANLYTLARVLLYCAIIATSRQPVEDFFQTLNVFGSATLNSSFALAVTVVMDLIAMNLFGRAIRAAFGKTHRLELTLAYGLPALAIIGANVLLTHRNIETKSNVQTNAKAEAEYKAELKIAKEKQETANSEYAAAAGVHFAKRWKGAPDPIACESGKVSCKGPFIQGNEKEQAAYSEKMASKAIADKAVADIEAKRPVLTDSASAAGVDQKLWVYLVLWAGVLMSYVYEPRKNKAGIAAQRAG